MTTELTPAEAARLDTLTLSDETPRDWYAVERGPLSGHAFAANGTSMVRDLTANDDVDADSITEADVIVARAIRSWKEA